MAGGLAIIAIFWVLPIWYAHGQGLRKNRTGWPWGFLLGWLGCLLLACTATLPSEAELRVRELEAQQKLAQLER